MPLAVKQDRFAGACREERRGGAEKGGRASARVWSQICAGVLVMITVRIMLIIMIVLVIIIIIIIIIRIRIMIITNSYCIM